MDQNIEALSVDQLTSADFYEKLRKDPDYKNMLTRKEIGFKILERARVLKIRTHVKEQLAIIDRQLKEEAAADRASGRYGDNVTNFSPDYNGNTYPALYCGSWLASDEGIQSMETSRAMQRACYHPIIPVKRMSNIENGEEQIVLAYKRRSGGIAIWNEITVPKDMVANSRSITGLAKYGIAVTSENAKLLVKYLADVENYNDDIIRLFQSSSKLGWHDGRVFLPYDTGITFDAGMRFPQITKAITEHGDYDKWLEHMKAIRSAPYVEPRIALAASFSSVLVKFLGIASVIVDFWGATEAGKTVMLMVAASVWACPDEGQYIGDFMTTDAELEARCDVLNNLPLILDDTAKMKKSIKENLEQVVYNLASGTGKKRSNKELGSERVRTWKNAVIVNGERPLNGFAEQGGAINRIIEVGLSGERLFDSPSETAELVRENYGFAGKVFVNEIKKIEDLSVIRKRHEKYCEALTSKNSMQKQVLAMAVILLADDLATEYVFKDGKALKPDDVRMFLTDRQMISEGARCYLYLRDIIYEQGGHFEPQPANSTVEQWGEIDYVGIYPDGITQAEAERKNIKPIGRQEYINFSVHKFEEIVENGGFTRKAFTSWAKREGLIRANNRDVYHRWRKDIYGKANKSEPQDRFISVLVVPSLDDYLTEKHMFE